MAFSHFKKLQIEMPKRKGRDKKRNDDKTKLPLALVGLINHREHKRSSTARDKAKQMQLGAHTGTKMGDT